MTILYRKYDDGKEVVLMCPFKVEVLDFVFVVGFEVAFDLRYVLGVC